MIEALSASGLRSCRYALECKGIDSIIANDLSVSAVDEIKQNIEYNEVSNIVTANCDDAIDLLTRHRSKAMLDTKQKYKPWPNCFFYLGMWSVLIWTHTVLRHPF